MRGHVVLSLEQLAGNSYKVSENVLCPAVIVCPGMGGDCLGGVDACQILANNIKSSLHV